MASELVDYSGVGDCSTEDNGGEPLEVKQDRPERPRHKCSEQEMQSNAATYEKRMDALQQELRVRNETMVELADENEGLNSAFMELKGVLKRTISDRDGLSKMLEQQRMLLQTVQSALRKADAEADDARREATEARVCLADAKAEVWAIREAAKGKALGEEERKDLEGALKALSASVQRAAQEAGFWKEKASFWKGKAESLKGELTSKEKALISVESELAVACQGMKDAETSCQEAAHLQAVAEQDREQLRKETERRAHTFNAALRSAVSKIQTELEAERDTGLQCIATLQADMELKVRSLMESYNLLESTRTELSVTHSRIEQLEEDNQTVQEEVSKLQEQVGFWQSVAQAAGKKSEASWEESEVLIDKIAKLERHCEELTTASDSALHSAAMLEVSLREDVFRLERALITVQNENHLLKATSTVEKSKSAEDLNSMRAEISDLESRLRGMQRQALISKDLDSTLRALQKQNSQEGSTLDNVGLEALREECLQRKAKHRIYEGLGNKLLEAGLGQRIDKQQSTKGTTESWSWGRNQHQNMLLLRGHLSWRSFVMLIYILLLHLMVMVLFTHRSCVDVMDDLSTARLQLPGL